LKRPKKTRDRSSSRKPVGVIPEAWAVHRTPGRLRIKVPAKRGDTEYFSQLEEHFSGQVGVESVVVNPTTGSALFVGESETRSIAHHGLKCSLFTLRKAKRSRHTLFESVAATFKSGNDQLRNLTDGHIDIPSAVFMSLLGTGLYQIFRGNVAVPAWYTAFYYALGIFTKTKVDELDETEDLLEDFEGED
jgi:hypothetical protein